jgi:hypothetical protein
MAGAIAGALGGRDAVPSNLADDVAAASKVDLVAPGERIADVTREIRAADADRATRTRADFDQLVDE